MFKSLFIGLFMFFSLSSYAGPAQQERAEWCKVEAQAAGMALGAKLQGLSKDDFEAAMKAFREQAEADEAVTDKSQIKAVERAFRDGFSGKSPAMVFESCMAQKQT